MTTSDEVLALLVEQVQAEIARADALHSSYRSAHEGYAVILEELDELWDEVRRKRSARDQQAMRREAVQIAATAIRFARDVCR